MVSFRVFQVNIKPLRQDVPVMKLFNYPSPAAEKRLTAIAGRDINFRKKDVQTVSRILAEVKKKGDAAVIDFTRQFDAPKMTAGDLIVSEAELAGAGKKVSRKFRQALNRAVSQIEAFHEQQRPRSWFQASRPGVFLGQMAHPVDAAGIYVPGAQGGKTPLVSSVLMGGIPAKIAGVGHVAMTTPPTRTGEVDPHLLVAARKIGIDVIYKAGSAWAVAALAYGTETVRNVDVIVGPGNIYVTLAKKLVAGTVGIDMIAGPSEILVIADATANPDHIAADLLSQAEHDPLSSSILLTDNAATAQGAIEAVGRQLEQLGRKSIAAESLHRFGGVFLVPDIDTAIGLANRLAPEHLELLVETPLELVGQIRNAGAVFLGHHTPEPVGDYVAGPNHVLPTAGTARFASALSVDNFVKKTSLLQYSEAAFRREAGDIVQLAEVEGLGAHANSIRVRLKK